MESMNTSKIHDHAYTLVENARTLHILYTNFVAEKDRSFLVKGWRMVDVMAREFGG